MTTTTRPTTIGHPRPSQRLAIDPYRVDDFAWTREEILTARGYPCSRPSATRQRRTSGRRHG